MKVHKKKTYQKNSWNEQWLQIISYTQYSTFYIIEYLRKRTYVQVANICELRSNEELVVSSKM